MDDATGGGGDGADETVAGPDVGDADAEPGLLAELRANPRLAAVEVGSLAVALGLPVATLWALVSGPRPDTAVLAAVVVVGAAFASLWTLVYPVYDAL
ncbi:hypothetical protein [Halostella litorea]|uniref:hypothetical protein n=1 Tax=Halostella litorea TaxID=2528831 RepID=UPI001091B8FE|nr:hypothetical protein [Halostella litorea]